MRYRNRGDEDSYRGRELERDPRWRDEIDTGRRGEGVFRRDYADPRGEHRTSARYERGLGYRAGYGDVRRDDANRWGVTRVYGEYGPPAPYSDQWDRGQDTHAGPDGRGGDDRYGRARYGRGPERNFRPEPWAGPPGDYDRWIPDDRERFRAAGDDRGYGRDRGGPGGRSFRGGMDRDYEPEPDQPDRGRYGWGSPWPDDDDYAFGRERNDRTHDANFDTYRYGSGRWGGDRNW